MPKPFVKGDPRINRKGRPKGSGLNLTKILKTELEKIPKGKKESYSKLFIEKLLHKAMIEGDMQALKLVMNYVDGLPKQDISIEGDTEFIVNIIADKDEK